MPAEHGDREEQDSSIEYFLSGAGERRGNPVGEQRHQSRTADTGDHAETDPGVASGQALGGGKHNTDNECGFEHFTEYNDGGC